MSPCPSPYPGAFFVICATLVVVTLVAVAVQEIARHRARRDAKTDELLRRGMREAWRRGLLKDGDQ
ncbi:MAG TPA: hypothetical protein VGK73_07770 [Polyangiaceae bacterium]